ncbi:hypothetical protein ASE52_23630 [Acidovorax sp. Root275]|uniref:hypothetical protein n=1 Tax=Acidovorax sp. Root275 TaxID=1736508 RepID=UPI0007112856|nr:hypothetical protein [Acidovorax sp. Root275]KRD40794.1 hypothetical protein ASE52_23630 [Acidovorax sp. Root275]
MSLEESLSAVEQLIEKVSAALLAADPQSLEKNSTALRDAAAQFARILEQTAARGLPLPVQLQKRVDAIHGMLANHREGLARLSANADRQVASLLPQAGSPATYGDGRGAQPGKPGVARIYKSAG